MQHARALGGSLSSGAGSPAADVAAARSAVSSAETQLRRELVQGSVTTDDGAVALLLGSMSAAVAQRQAAT